jgi:D-threo-aldose 1-dehydrogenase
MSQPAFAASTLGFGCSALVGGRTRRESERLLTAAFDAGIRHFDVARVYGSGDAERIVGAFASGRRDELSLASKFGMQSRLARRSAVPVKVAVRSVTRRSARALRYVRRYARATVVSGAFAPDEMRVSLEQSLRALGVDRLDLFLLHDCAPSDWLDESLRAGLADIVARGQAKRVGTATGYAETCELFERTFDRPTVVQFDDGAAAAHAREFRGRFGFDEIVTHGAFRSGFDELWRRLSGDASLAQEWGGALDVDVRSADSLAALTLAALLDANPAGVVLVSSGSEQRIRAHARVAEERPFTPEQLDEFRRLVRSLVADPA